MLLLVIINYVPHKVGPISIESVSYEFHGQVGEEARSSDHEQSQVEEWTQVDLDDTVPDPRLTPPVAKPDVCYVHQDAHNRVEEHVNFGPVAGPHEKVSSDHGVQAREADDADRPNARRQPVFTHNVVLLVHEQRHQEDDERVNQAQ